MHLKEGRVEENQTPLFLDVNPTAPEVFDIQRPRVNGIYLDRRVFLMKLNSVHSCL